MFDNGFFGGLFDFDNNGELDTFESIVDTAFFCHMMSENKDDDSSDDMSWMIDVPETTEIDIDELEYMDEDERYEAICEAGLDPDDYDF